MAIQWTVTFRGLKVLDSSEGVFNPPTLGFFKQGWKFETLMRARGDLAMELAVSGADHSLEVVFTNVALASLAGIRSRLAAFVGPLEGSLVIPDFGTFGHCVLVDVVPGAPVPTTSADKWGDGTGKGYDLPFTLSFHQNRE